MNVLSASVLLPLLAIFSHSANANVWTVDCFEQLATQRMDPIKFPGQSEAGHVHAIVGASKFDPDMTYDTLQTSQCNNCNAGDDMSNYWVPQLYIHKQSDGKFHYVPFEFHVYYKLINDCCQTTVNDPNNPNANPIEPGYFSAFPAGFRMVTGSPAQTTPLHEIGHRCLGMDDYPYTAEFPPSPELCTGGVRSEATFPACWDGVNLDSPDHYSHMSFPMGPSGEDGHWEGGECPSTHPFRFPTVFFEAIYHTQDIFEVGDQLVYSFDDYVGYGFHGDFFNGWKPGVVEALLDQCTYQTPETELYACGLDKSSSTECAWEGTHDDSGYTGVLDSLPPYSRGNWPENPYRKR